MFTIIAAIFPAPLPVVTIPPATTVIPFTIPPTLIVAITGLVLLLAIALTGDLGSRIRLRRKPPKSTISPPSP